MIVKVNCESDRIESPDQVAALFVHGALIGTPRAVENPNAQNGITFVLVLLYDGTEHAATMRLLQDALSFCDIRHQDCIAARMRFYDHEQASLFGPKADEWGAFNPAYFIE